VRATKHLPVLRHLLVNTSHPRASAQESGGLDEETGVLVKKRDQGAESCYNKGGLNYPIVSRKKDIKKKGIVQGTMDSKG